MSASSTAHLTQEELTDNLLRVSSLTVNAHLLGCPACAQELDRLRSSVADFRVAAHSWSESALATAERNASHARAVSMKSRPAMGWVLATAMVLFVLIVGSTAYLRQRRIAGQAYPVQIATPLPNSGPSQAQLDQDNALLSQVSSELSEGVPAPMQPLLVSESGASSSVTNKQIVKR
jgi:predicted anti-sigma-YlaC factor YlaD